MVKLNRNSRRNKLPRTITSGLKGLWWERNLGNNHRGNLSFNEGCYGRLVGIKGGIHFRRDSKFMLCGQLNINIGLWGLHDRNTRGGHIYYGLNKCKDQNNILLSSSNILNSFRKRWQK